MTGTTNYQNGDWVVYDYKVNQITAMEDGKVREVNDGDFTNGSSDLTSNIRPLTLRNLSLVTNFQYYYREIHELEGGMNINWPQVNAKLNEFCLMQIDADTDEKWNTASAATDKWFRAFKKAVKEAKEIEVDGVPLFKKWC